MARTQVTFTVPEAGYVLGRSSKVVNKAIDDGEIAAIRRPTRTRVSVIGTGLATGKSVVREIGEVEIRYLALLDTLTHFSAQGRKHIYQTMRRLPPGASKVELGPVRVELAEVDKSIAPRVSRVLKLRQAVETKNGVAVLKGTTVPVYLVGALKDYSSEAICDAYPSLSLEQVATALDYVKVHPKPGRPYPRQTLKDRISDLASKGVFDEPDALEPLSLGELAETFG